MFELYNLYAIRGTLLETYRYRQEHLKAAQKKEGKGEAPKK
jgi:outer membrane protein TolC